MKTRSHLHFAVTMGKVMQILLLPIPIVWFCVACCYTHSPLLSCRLALHLSIVSPLMRHLPIDTTELKKARKTEQKIQASAFFPPCPWKYYVQDHTWKARGFSASWEKCASKNCIYYIGLTVILVTQAETTNTPSLRHPRELDIFLSRSLA